MPIEMFNSAYKGKKILVTGHTGFKGSWLSLWLNEMGAEIIGLSLDPYTPNDFFVKTQLAKKITDLRGNICNLEFVKQIFEKYKPDIVFHLAAQPIVRLSYDNPVETYQVNAMGTMNLLEAIRFSKSVQAAIFITTDKVYFNKEQIWGYREDDALGGYDPYAASKACCEIIIDSYRNSFFKHNSSNKGQNIARIASVRAGNVLGGGDWQKDRLIPDCINDLTKGKPITIRNPKATRPWQHVVDALGGYLFLGEKLLNKDQDQFTQGWNFGPMFESMVSVEEIVKRVVKYWGKGEWKDISNPNEIKHEANLLTLDITKAIVKLGWNPILSFDESIQLTINWYKHAFENPDKNMYAFSVNQIQEYQKIAIQKNRNWMNSPSK